MKRFLFSLLLVLLPTIAQATDRFVSTTGSGSTCSIGSPCSLATGIPLTVAGDTLNLRSGTYTTRFDSNVLTMNSGTNFTSGAVRFYSYDGVGAAIIQPTTNNGAVVLFKTPALQYVIFDGLTLDCPNLTGTGQSCGQVGSGHAGADHIRFINVESRNTGANGSPTAETGAGFIIGGDDNEIINCNVHHNGFNSPNTSGNNAVYGFYITGSRNLVRNCDIHHNGAYGVHVYNTGGGVNDDIIENNRVYENGAAQVFHTFAILVTAGSGHIVRNNIVWNTLANPNLFGISVGNDFIGCTNCFAYYNTVVGFPLYGIKVSAPSTGAIVRNNIAHNNTLGNLDNEGSGSTFSNNLCTSACGVGTTNTNQTEAATATFTNLSTQDFTLKSTSLAKDHAVDVGGISTDIIGTSRPAGASDIGAYEFLPAATCPSTSPALVAAFSFDNTSNDSSGYGLTAILGAGVTYTPSGKYGQGLIFTGAGGVTVADNNLLDFCNAFTLEAWVNVPSVSSDSMFINKNPNSTYFLGNLSGFAPLQVLPAGGFGGSSSAIAFHGLQLTPSTLTHLAVTYDGTTVSLYKNGAAVSTATSGAIINATTGSLQFCDSSFGELCASGTVLDEVRLYNYARSPAQLVTDMNTPITPIPNIVLQLSSTNLKIGPGVTLKFGVP